MPDNKDKCMNGGCGRWDKTKFMWCNDPRILSSNDCDSFTTTPTESITVERREKLEEKERWYNPPEGEWELSATVGRLQAQIKQLKADKVEAVEQLKKAREFCDEVQSPRSAAIYRSEQIQSYLSRQEQGEKP